MCEVPVEYGHTSEGERVVSIALNGQNFDTGTTEGQGKPHRYRYDDQRHRTRTRTRTRTRALP